MTKIFDVLSLRFDDARLEAEFRNERSRAVTRPVSLVAFVGGVAVAGFGLLDLGHGEIALPLVALRYGLMVPLLLGVSALVWQPGLRRWTEELGASTLAVVATAEAAYLLWAPVDRIAVYQTGFVLLLVGGQACTRIRWMPVAWAGLAATGFDLLLLSTVELGSWQRAAFVLYLATANGLGLLVARHQEETARDRFLAGRKLRRQKDELARLNRTLREMALRDSLTGLYNRRALEDRLEEAMAAAARGGSSSSLVMLDLDGFKEVNDRLGHAAGDRVLEGVAKATEEELRGSDRAYRLGGDEFCLFLPSTPLEEAEGIAERLRSRIRSETAELETPVGLSAGCTRIRPSDRSPDDPLGRADSLLYLAKANGGDRVIADGGKGSRKDRDGELVPVFS
ncbi:MAG: GGDEF domain-containing protein [Thermoanaerobaculia bacterium]|nr:GGDEF domain-containing protein [Thermoanaerobaculia bacterium]